MVKVNVSRNKDQRSVCMVIILLCKLIGQILARLSTFKYDTYIKMVDYKIPSECVNDLCKKNREEFKSFLHVYSDKECLQNVNYPIK